MMQHTHKRHILDFSVVETLSNMSYTALFSLWLVVAFGFGFIYYGLAEYAPSHAPMQLTDNPTNIGVLFDSIYYSVITATSVGYGDITPQGLSKVLSCIQSIIALVVFAIFVTKLVSNKQELALEQIHKLTFEDVFHDVRAGLYIVRKDFDLVISEAQQNKHVTEKHWRNLVAAFDQLQSFIQEIPNFYKTNNQFYTIDKKRETILLEAMYRTLDRLEELIQSLIDTDTEWKDHIHHIAELKTLLILTKKTIHLWRWSTPYTQSAKFKDIKVVYKRIETLTHTSIPYYKKSNALL